MIYLGSSGSELRSLIPQFRSPSARDIARQRTLHIPPRLWRNAPKIISWEG